MSAASESAVRIGLVYPELLGTYGDRGNAVVLVQRLRWRGHAAELVEVTAEARSRIRSTSTCSAAGRMTRR